MLKMKGNRVVAFGTLGALTLSTALGTVTTTPARADADTWKKIAIGAGVVTGYGLLKHKGKVATIGGIATAGSYIMYRNKKKKEEQQRRAWYKQRYGRKWSSHYDSGT